MVNTVQVACQQFSIAGADEGDEFKAPSNTGLPLFAPAPPILANVTLKPGARSCPFERTFNPNFSDWLMGCPQETQDGGGAIPGSR